MNNNLEGYRELIISYEDSRQAYEETIKLYEDKLTSDTRPVKVCHYIKAENKSATVTKWQLYTLYGTLYISGKYKALSVWSIDLKLLVDSDGNPLLKAGDRFLLKALVVAGADSVSDVVLEYQPDIANTANFKLSGTAFNTTLNYLYI